MSVESLLAKVGEGFHAGRSFGPVIEGDGCLIVPVAITAGGGGGGGEATGREATGREATGEATGEQATGEATGAGPESSDGEIVNGGGGFGGISWPVGVYVIKDGDARWVPAFDATRVVIGILALLRVLLPVARKRRRRRSRDQAAS